MSVPLNNPYHSNQHTLKTARLVNYSSCVTLWATYMKPPQRRLLPPTRTVTNCRSPTKPSQTDWNITPSRSSASNQHRIPATANRSKISHRGRLSISITDSNAVPVWLLIDNWTWLNCGLHCRTRKNARANMILISTGFHFTDTKMFPFRSLCWHLLYTVRCRNLISNATTKCVSQVSRLNSS